MTKEENRTIFHGLQVGVNTVSMWIFRVCWNPALLDCPRQDCSSTWTTTTVTMATTTSTRTTMTTTTTTAAAASCFLLVVGSKGESCFSDGISGVVTSGADRSHSGLQICHPQPARPCLTADRAQKFASLSARSSHFAGETRDLVRKRIPIHSAGCISATTTDIAGG